MPIMYDIERLPAPGTVIYIAGQDHCLELLSGACCRLVQMQWGRIPADPPGYSSYWVRPLGSQRQFWLQLPWADVLDHLYTVGTKGPD
ncbi:MAG: hypothetical protein NZL92_01915 [Gloeomargarita sp. SKYG116]|nr:hypothetical protein [Gloeomargarita sp. SKYG116]MCS7226884.1 hypothetical protein [Gloeomargarita sp. SKYB31]MDW8400435.1 hypothetical protein [Gloeomargarita sp. SKYGB_i_bin116]